MSDSLLLNTTNESRHQSKLKITCSSKLFKGILEGKSDDLFDRSLLPDNIQNELTVWRLIEKWQEMLSLLLLCRERGDLQGHAVKFLEPLRRLCACFAWPEMQLWSMYKAICSLLLDQPAEKPEVHQYPSGATPFERGERWSWGTAPQCRFQAELGFLWCLYGQLTGDIHYFKAAESLADWQLNTLNYHGQPLVGLFTQEEHGSELKLLINNYLLFSAVAVFSERKDMAAFAERHFDRMAALSSDVSIEFSPLQFVYHHWLSHYPKQQPEPLRLSGLYKDESLLLAGYRSEIVSVASTLAGGGTSMGSLCRGDLQIVSFGPQHYPLGDCRGFGIETQQGWESQSTVKVSLADKSYCVEGIARVSPEPKTSTQRATYRNGEHSGTWIEAKQIFRNEQLTIEAIFHGLFDVSSLLFVFFVKANSCTIESLKEVKQRSFERYQGEVKKIILHGDKEILEIEAQEKQGGMQVIPLGGGDNFWGADFLVAYPLISQKSKYTWIIK